MGNPLSSTLVSCRHSTSGLSLPSQVSRRSSRARIELIFQVASFTGGTCGGLTEPTSGRLQSERASGCPVECDGSDESCRSTDVVAREDSHEAAERPLSLIHI